MTALDVLDDGVTVHWVDRDGVEHGVDAGLRSVRGGAGGAGPADRRRARTRPVGCAAEGQHGAGAGGALPDVIPFEVYCHSLSDASILGPAERAAGYQTLTLFGLHTPMADCLARDGAGDPCLRAASPLDVEESLAMPGGHIFHGDLAWPVAATPEQAGTWGVATAHPRIVAASSGGTVRGGAISGPGGYAAAQHLLDPSR